MKIRNVHWLIKILGKLIFSRIPLSHKNWVRIGVFKYGNMQDFTYAFDVFNSHLEWSGLGEAGRTTGKVALELGPGESLFSALLMRTFGFQSGIIIDAGNFSVPEPDIYKEFAKWLRGKDLSCPPVYDSKSIEEMLASLNVRYLTQGLPSLLSLPDSCVDFIYSQAVLGDIRKSEFIDTVRELWRILKPGGVSTHRIDFRDHLADSLNNLRFPDWLWESDCMASSGFYTNRIRFNQMLKVFETQGFEVSLIERKEWKTLPLARARLDPQFRSLPDADLLIYDAVFRLKKMC